MLQWNYEKKREQKSRFDIPQTPEERSLRMKKQISMLCFILLLSMMIAPFSYAAGDNYDTLADWDIRIAVPENTNAVLEGREYYIYAQHDGSIPYVMLRPYRYSDEQSFITDFTEYMKEQYPDLSVTSEMTRKTIGNKTCWEIDYTYKVSGYDVRDRRVAIAHNDLVYMFASKEIEAIGLTVGTMLDDVIADCEFLSVGSDRTEVDQPKTTGLAEGYLYCNDAGMPKYWLDMTGVLSDNPVLHCYFRSGDPMFYESWFVLDLTTAEYETNTLRIHHIYDEYDFDHSDWFDSFTIRFYSDGAVIDVDRDERTLAGGAEDNILSGRYVMFPVGVGVEYKQVDKELLMPFTFLKPEHDGPYAPIELGKWAQICYFTESGFFPPRVDVNENADGSYSIHLYEVVTQDGITHTATSAWFTVNAFGIGINDITGEAICLTG